MKRSFWEVGQWLQITAKTVEEADERFESSCDRGNKLNCNENKCPIAKAHEIRCLAIEAEKSKGTIYYISTRKYKKITPEVKTRKILLSYLTKLSKICTSRSKTLILDQASVMVELGEFTTAYWYLRNRKLVKTADKVMEIIRKYKEEN